MGGRGVGEGGGGVMQGGGGGGCYPQCQQQQEEQKDKDIQNLSDRLARDEHNEEGEKQMLDNTHCF